MCITYLLYSIFLPTFVNMCTGDQGNTCPFHYQSGKGKGIVKEF